MRHETFSYLPALTSDEVEAQIRSVLERGLVVGIEYTRQPSPYDYYWTLWKLPLFQIRDPEIVLTELEACRREHPDAYVRLSGYDSVRQGQVLAFVVHEPSEGE